MTTPETETSPGLAQRVAINATALAAGRIFMSVTGVVSVGIVTRYLGVSTYGVFTTALAFVTALGPLTDIGVSTIATRELAKRPEDRDRLIGNVIGLSFIFVAISATVGIGLAHAVYSGPDDEQVRNAIMLMILLALPTGPPAVAITAYFISQQRAWVSVVASVCGSAVTLIGLVLVVALDWGFYGIVIAYAGTAIGYGWALILMALGRIRLRPRLDPTLSRQLVAWALPIGIASVMHMFHLRTDVFVLSLVSTEAEVGLFGLAFRAAEILMGLPFFITITLMPEFARLARSQQDRLYRLVQRALSLLIVAALPLLGSVFVFAEEVVRIVGGDDFGASAGILRILTIGVAVTFVGGIIGQAMVAMNRQKVVLGTISLGLVVHAALAVALAPSLGADGVAIAFVCGESVGVATLLTVYRRAGTAAPGEWQPRLLVAAAAMAAAGLIRFPLENLADSPILTLAVGSAAMVGVYAGALYALRAMPPEIQNGLIMPLLRRLRLARP
jgi:O-antigen/teichoic acid export membrane protein